MTDKPKIISTIKLNGQYIDNLRIGDTVYAVEKLNGKYIVNLFTVCKVNKKDVDMVDYTNNMGEPVYKKTPFLYITMVHNNQRYTYKTISPHNGKHFLILETNPYRQIECFVEYEDAVKFITTNLNGKLQQLQNEINERTNRIEQIKQQLNKYQ